MPKWFLLQKDQIIDYFCIFIISFNSSFVLFCRKYGHKIIGKWGVNSINWVFNYICYKNHPLIQIMYCLIFYGGFYLYYVYGFGEHFPNSLVNYYHYYTGLACGALCAFVYIKACTTSPGAVTKENNKEYLEKYKFDGIMFANNNKCSTCRFNK